MLPTLVWGTVWVVVRLTGISPLVLTLITRVPPLVLGPHISLVEILWTRIPVGLAPVVVVALETHSARPPIVPHFSASVALYIFGVISARVGILSAFLIPITIASIVISPIPRTAPVSVSPITGV